MHCKHNIIKLLCSSYIMNLAEKTVIATTTMYPTTSAADTLRSRLALQTVEAARKKEYAVVVVDQKSPDAFRRAVEDLGARLIVQEQGAMQESRKAAIQAAYETERAYLCWTEPEKVGYVRFIERTLHPLEGNKADLVVPARSSLDDYPSLQKRTESLLNDFWESLTGLRLDITFGPRSWRRDVTQYFLQYGNAEDGPYGVTFVPLLQMVADRKRIVPVVVGYGHPAKQRQLEKNDLEFTVKRFMQLYTISSDLLRWHKRLFPQNPGP